MWQDAVLFAGQIVAVGSHWMTIQHPTHKPPLNACALGAVLMTAFALTYASLGLWLSALGSAALMCTQCVIGWQRRQLNLKEIREEVAKQDLAYLSRDVGE